MDSQTDTPSDQVLAAQAIVEEMTGATELTTVTFSKISKLIAKYGVSTIALVEELRNFVPLEISEAVEDTLGGCDQSADLSSAVDLITEGARAFKVSKPVFARPEYAHLLPIIDHLVAASASLGQAARDSSQGQVDKMRASVSKVRDAALNRLLANMRQIEFVEGHNGKDKKAWRSCNIAVLTCICEREQALAVVDERMDE